MRQRVGVKECRVWSKGRGVRGERQRVKECGVWGKGRGVRGER